MNRNELLDTQKIEIIKKYGCPIKNLNYLIISSYGY